MCTMFLDDIRVPEKEYDVIVRSFDEATFYVKKNGIPKFISFDYDLGFDKNGEYLKNGYDFAKWLVEESINGEIKFPDDFSFEVHSKDLIEKNNIKSLLNNYLLFSIKLI